MLLSNLLDYCVIKYPRLIPSKERVSRVTQR